VPTWGVTVSCLLGSEVLDFDTCWQATREPLSTTLMERLGHIYF